MRVQKSPASLRGLTPENQGARGPGQIQRAQLDPLAHQRSGYQGLDATGRMTNAIQSERANLNQQKLSFTPAEQKKLAAWETQRRTHNSGLQKELGKVSDQIAKIQADPKLSPEAKKKQLAGLQKKKAELRAKMKPAVDAQRLTAEVDRIMNDPSIKDKKKALQEVREKAGLSGDQMHEMFTGRLGRLNGESKKRLEGVRNQLNKALGTQLHQAEKTFGKDSPQAQAIRAQLDGVERTSKKEIVRLNTKAGQLDGAFKRRRRRRIGSRIKAAFKKLGRKMKAGFKKVGRALKKGFQKIGQGLKKGFQAIGKGLKKIGKYLLMGLDFLVAGLSFIPGIGQIVGMAYNGVRMIVDFARKDWKSGLMRLTGMIPGVGGALTIAGAIGGKVADVVVKVADIAKKTAGAIKGTVGAVKAGISKNWGGMVSGILGAAGSAAGAAGTDAGAKAADVIGHIAKGATVVDAAARKDIGGAIGAAAGLAGGIAGEFNTSNAQKAQQIIGHVGRGGAVVDAAVRKDIGGAIGAAAGVAGGVAGTFDTARAQKAQVALGHIGRGGAVIDAAVRRDIAGALLAASSLAGGVAGNFDTAKARRADEIIDHIKRSAGIVDGLMRQDFEDAIAAAAGVAGGFDTPQGRRAAEILAHMAQGTGIFEQVARERDFGGALMNAGAFSGGLGAPRQVQNAFNGAGHAVGGEFEELVELMQRGLLSDVVRR